MSMYEYLKKEIFRLCGLLGQAGRTGDGTCTARIFRL